MFGNLITVMFEQAALARPEMGDGDRLTTTSTSSKTTAPMKAQPPAWLGFCHAVANAISEHIYSTKPWVKFTHTLAATLDNVGIVFVLRRWPCRRTRHDPQNEDPKRGLARRFSHDGGATKIQLLDAPAGKSAHCATHHRYAKDPFYLAQRIGGRANKAARTTTRDQSTPIQYQPQDIQTLSTYHAPQKDWTYDHLTLEDEQ